MNLVCFNIQIRQDAQGRYCLNDLHKAAGGENRHRPSIWTENNQTKELIEEISKAGIPALAVVKGGNKAGTYVCKELVYAYAMWISAKFHLHVIQTFDQFAMSEQVRIAERQAARLEVEHSLDSAISLTTQQSHTTIPEYFFAMMIENFR